MSPYPYIARVCVLAVPLALSSLIFSGSVQAKIIGSPVISRPNSSHAALSAPAPISVDGQPLAAQANKPSRQREKDSNRSIDRYLITVEGATQATREAIHDVIIHNADGWWAQMENSWIVGGLSVSEWQILLIPATDGQRVSSLLILKLPDTKGTDWSLFGKDAEARTAWLRTNYSIRRGASKRPIAGQITIHKSWDTGTYPLGASDYQVGISQQSPNAAQVTLSYRGQSLAVSQQGQQFSLRPYANTTATATVTQFLVSEAGIHIEISLTGKTSNPSSVVAGGYNDAFSGNLVIVGKWDQDVLNLGIKETNRWSSLGNAQWEGSAALRP